MQIGMRKARGKNDERESVKKRWTSSHFWAYPGDPSSTKVGLSILQKVSDSIILTLRKSVPTFSTSGKNCLLIVILSDLSFPVLLLA